MANTPDGAARLSAIDCAFRGIAILRVHGLLLVGVRLLRNLILAVLLVASLVPPVLALGLDLWADRPRNLDEGLEWLADLAARLAPTPKLLGAIGGMLVLWLIAGYVYCYFQAGLYGLLAEADREASGASGARSLGRQDLAAWGRARLGRYFALANLYGALVGGALLLALLGVGAVAAASATWGPVAAVGIGFVALVPVFLTFLVSAVWYDLACAALAREGAGTREASRGAWKILGQRLGAVGLLLVLFASASMAIWLTLFPLSVLISFSTNGRPLLAFVGHGLFQLVAAVPGAVAETVFAGSWVALVRSEALGA